MKPVLTTLCVGYLATASAWAADDSCQATYLPNSGKLVIPCVAVSAEAAGTYAVTMQQVSTIPPWQFVIEQMSARSTIPPDSSEGLATYLVETGELLLPSVKVLESSSIPVKSYEAIMTQSTPDSQVFTLIALNSENAQQSGSRSLRALSETETIKKIQAFVSRFTNGTLTAAEQTRLIDMVRSQFSLSDKLTAGLLFAKFNADATPLVLTKAQKTFIDNMLSKALKANSKNAANQALINKAISELAKAITAKKVVVK